MIFFKGKQHGRKYCCKKCSIRCFFGEAASFSSEELSAVAKVARNQIEVTSWDILTFLHESGTAGLTAVGVGGGGFFGGVGGTFFGGVGGTCFRGVGGTCFGGGGGGGYDGTSGKSSPLIVLILMYCLIILNSVYVES